MFLSVQDPAQRWVHAQSLTLSIATSYPVRWPYYIMSTWDFKHPALVSARKCTQDNFQPEACGLSKPQKSTRSSLRVHEQEQIPSIQKNSMMIKTLDGASDDTDDMLFLTSRNQPASSMQWPHLTHQSRLQSSSGEDLRSQQVSADQDPAFLDPFGEGIVSSRRTSASSDTSVYLRQNAFPGHRDTLARLPGLTFVHYNQENVLPLEDLSHAVLLPSLSSPSFTFDRDVPRNGLLPPSIVSDILRFLSSEEYKALRLVCRLWNTALPFPKVPVVFRLPREVVQHIYSYLLPSGFDAARHTCREWYLASLDRSVQDPIAKASFCQLALDADLQLRRDLMPLRSSSGSLSRSEDNGHSINQEWIYSKRLATESRISPNWRGGPPLTNKNELHSRLSVTGEIDFSRILQNACSGRSRFTVSTCGKFLLVVSGEEITLYDIFVPGGSVFPVTRMVAGSEVLKVSMDTTCGRCSVAALLSGRVGMLWDLLGTLSKMDYCNPPGDSIDLGMKTVVQDAATSFYAQPTPRDLRNLSEESVVSEGGPYPARVLSMLATNTGTSFIPSPPSS